MSETKCQAAIRWASFAVFISLVALIVSTWFLPKLTWELRRLNDLVEKNPWVTR